MGGSVCGPTSYDENWSECAAALVRKWRCVRRDEGIDEVRRARGRDSAVTRLRRRGAPASAGRRPRSGLDEPPRRRLDRGLDAGARPEFDACVVDVEIHGSFARPRICAISAEVLPRAAHVRVSISRSFN